MKRKVIALITVVVAAIGSVVAFVAVTIQRIANMRLTQYAYDVADGNTAGNAE